MLTIETFKKRLTKVNSPDWLSVAIDANNVRQLYIVVNGGMGNTISTPIERYPPEIKEYVVKMLSFGELIIAKKTVLLLEIDTLVYYLSLSSTIKGGA
ncbi:MAG: hypothetical protein JKX76_14455 [Colwellia sp.]|nr:hypothetical protein [Colwellia sp.]